MKKILALLGLLTAFTLALAPTEAAAQCTGIPQANKVCAGPGSGTGAPGWRSLVGSDFSGSISGARQMLQSGASGTSQPAFSTTTWPATSTINRILYSSAANVVGEISTVNGGIINANSSGVPASTVTPVIGVPGTSTGTLGLAGITSGTATITPQAAAGTPTLTLPNASGTFAVTATSPIVLSATTGNLTCPTCVTSSGGGGITGVAPVAVSAGGAVSITGVAGAVLAGSAPAFTATPVLGVAGTTLGTLGFQNLTSGTITLSPPTGALGTVTLTMPAVTDTLAALAATQALTNKTYNGLTVTSTTGSLTVTNGKTFAVQNTLTLAGTDSTVMTFPGASDTVMGLGAIQTVTAAKTFNSGKFILGGSSSGTITLNAAAAAGSSTIVLPGGSTDFSATGGPSQVVKQTSSGGAFTVARLACSDLSDSAGGCTNSGANPTASVGLSTVNGSAATYMRSDAAPALSQAIAPTWTAQHIHTVASTIASATGAALDDVKVSAATTTITGNTGSPITQLAKVGIYRPTLTDSSAVTVTDAASLYIDNSPLAAGSVTITNPWALLVGAGASKLQATTLNGALTYGGVTLSNAVSGTGNMLLSANQTITGTLTAAAANYSGSLAANASFTMAQDFYRTGEISITISADQNNWAPTGLSTASVIRVNGGAADRNITGLTGGALGRRISILNVGTTNGIILKNASGSSTASNQFCTGADITFAANGQGGELTYDNTATCWRLSSAYTTAGGTSTGTVTSVTCNNGLDGGTFTTSGTCSLSSARRTLPTSQVFLSGSGTYTTPSNVLWIEITLVGGGAGGTGGNGGGNGTAGGNTCWNTSGAACTSPVYQAGGAALTGNTGTGAAGTVSGSGTCTSSVAGGRGQGAQVANANLGSTLGGQGGSSSLGGNGGGAQYGSSAGIDAAANSGSGGGGGGDNNSSGASGPGGSAGATCYVILGSPAATYTYAVGAAGTGGSAGSNAGAGGNGGAGKIVVIEHYGT